MGSNSYGKVKTSNMQDLYLENKKYTHEEITCIVKMKTYRIIQCKHFSSQFLCKNMNIKRNI